MMNKKGQLLTTLIFVILVVMFFMMIADNMMSGCKSDSACGEGYYCGVDKQCHKVPVIEKTIVKETTSYDLTGPALVLGVSLIIAAMIYKWKV